MKIWLGLILICLLAGCKSQPAPLPPPPEIIQTEIIQVDVFLQPVTTELLEQLDEYAIKGLQYYISNQVVLVRENYELRGKPSGGAIELTSAYARDMKIIYGKTKGEVTNIASKDGKRVLEVSFGPDSDEVLRFVQGEGGYFNLEMLNEAEGTALFGAGDDSKPYRVLAASKLTRLLVNIDSISDVRSDEALLPGRTVEGGDFYDDFLLDKQEGPLLNSGSPESVPQSEFMPEPAPEPADSGYIGWSDWPSYEEPAEDEFGEMAAAPPMAEPVRDLEPAESVYDPPSPPLPAPSQTASSQAAGGAYRVQVGAFISLDNARQAFDRLQAAGFRPDYERYSDYYRVIIPGIAAGDISSITQRLDSAGFPEIWIQEDH